VNANVPASSDNTSKTAEATRRIVRLAISWYAVDPLEVERILRAVQELHEQAGPSDFLEALQEAKLISAAQAKSLRFGEAPTEVFVPRTPLDGAPAEPRPTKLGPPPVNGDPGQMGPYRILRRLGQGGMGAVYLAFDAKGNRQVAVKVLAAEQAPKPNILRRFQLEGQHGAALAHPNIVRSFDSGQDEPTGLHYLVLEYVDGQNVHELLEQSGKLKVGDAIHIILDVARALEHAHKKQIIHRDIKPGNILLNAAGLAKLSDLGLAKRRDDSSNLTNTSQGIGTPYYMPYEQAMNAKMADERSDIYALGATLFHLVTGEVPFPGESSLEIVEKKGVGAYPPARALNPEVPDLLEDMLAKMMARDPEDRYQTVSDVIVDLERSQLAHPIPSFVSMDSALQDPVVRQRLTAPIQPTQPDMQLKEAIEEKEANGQTIWFLRYRDQRGNLCKSKATTKDLLARLRKGSIPTDMEAARTPQGKYKPLSNWPEFDAAVRPAKKPGNPKASEEAVNGSPWQSWQSSWWLAVAVAGAGLLVIVGAAIFFFVLAA
jgi:eukaryotic-like serine/threonine-protein kinase